MASLDHLNLTVRNFRESAEWYRRVFGFEIVERGQIEGSPWGVLRSEESMLCIYESPERKILDDEKYHQIHHFGLRIRDPEKWERTIRTENLQVEYGGAYPYPHSTSWYITDPTGHSIEVVHWKQDRVRF